MKSQYLAIVFFLLAVTVSASVYGNGNEVYFCAPTPQGQYEKTEIIYQNEYGISLYVKWGQNCSNWSIDMHSPLFIDSLSGITPHNIEAGEAIYTGLDLNPEASPGMYEVPVYLNYTNVFGRNETRRFDFVLENKQAIELVDVVLPSTNNKVLSVTVEVLYPLSDLRANFRAYGSIEAEDHEIILTEVKPGTYTFESRILKMDMPFGSGIQEVKYWITGVIDGRPIEIHQDPIRVTIQWNNTEEEKYIKDNNIWPLITVILVFLLVFNNLYYYYRKHKTK